MTRARYVQIGLGVAVVSVVAWGASKLLERMVSPRAAAPAAVAAPVAAGVPHIVATLYYATSDGQALAAVNREVPLADGVRAQGREILQSELEAAPSPFLSVIPPGTTVRAFFVTERGDAFVDLSSEVSTAHPGGATGELLTVYAIVNAVTTNLSSVHRVQILIDGKEADTLAGHVDLRHPLQRETSLVRAAQTPARPDAPQPR